MRVKTATKTLWEWRELWDQAARAMLMLTPRQQNSISHYTAEEKEDQQHFL